MAPKKVALVNPVAIPWVAIFFQGVAQYSEEHGNWDILTSPPNMAGAEEQSLTIRSLRDWPGDGIIASINSEEGLQSARNSRLPVVNVSSSMNLSDFPSVILDQHMTGALGAEHLMQCGFRRLAFYGVKGLYYSQIRLEGFLERAESAHIPVEVFEEERTFRPDWSWSSRMARLQGWLKTLPHPIGLMAVHDYRARVVIDACRELHLEIPQDIAVLGVDNDPTICDFCRPTLSSVGRNAFRQGYETAAMLDKLMSGKIPDRTVLIVPPDGINIRRSTDTLAVEDRYVTQTVRFFREHVGESFNLSRVLKELPISRRRLEKQFQRYMHCTPYEFLSKVRVEYAIKLIASNAKMKITDIAVASGFKNSQRFRIVFQRLTGQSPMKFKNSLLSSEGTKNQTLVPAIFLKNINQESVSR